MLEIAKESLAPVHFETLRQRHRINEANSTDQRYLIGDWSRGWHLTKKGLRFAKDVERSRATIKHH